MRSLELARARGLATLLGGLAAVAALWFPLLGGDPRLRAGAIAACVYLALASAFVLARASEPGCRALLRWYGASCAVVAVPIQLYIGLYSSAPSVVMIGIAFFGNTEDRKWGVAICASTIAAYALLATLVAIGAMPDLGLIRGLGSPAGKVFGAVMLPVAFVGFLRQMMLTRHATQVAIARALERDAQLAEVGRELDRALEAGAGQRGRHTGRRAGAWELGAMIGRGSMGEVYAATHVETDRQAAVKTLATMNDASHYARFRREVELAARLTGPGVAALYDAGTLDDLTPYLAMELLAGHDLAWHLRRTSRLAVRDARALCDHVAAGLDAAHAAGVVHRDLSPRNVMLDETSCAWKILDFGVGRLAGSHATLTQGLVVGTPGYMAPEQARGELADARSDLFSFGALMYRALTGHLPFAGDDTPQILFDVVFRAPRRPSGLAPELPHDVDLFLAIALAKRPDDRFGSARELAAALDAALARALPAPLRDRGELLIKQLPWGTIGAI
ncbi:MAG TPA: serine/threonine-protein kinase [Kofleriaceae bacterium]|jgi:serine/threonine-protein kinase